MVAVNALFPHLLARAAGATGTRLIHLSTDCVFSGRKGNYAEEDVPDAQDLYGRSKLVGEVTGAQCLTIRTSMIGREVQGRLALVEWFLSAESPVRGFRHATFSGLTTIRLADLIGTVIEEFPSLRGVYQVAAQPIDKHSLLHLIRDAYGRNVDITPDDQVRIDRSLDGRRFREETGITAPPWPAMITEMANDATPYDAIHLAHTRVHSMENA
jgi:dTDP-4-dehydrorhamnose reductase